MNASPIPVAIFVRVSSLRQVTDRQASELQAYALGKGYTVVETVKEVISGRALESERDGLQRVRELVVAGVIKKVLVHEVSRLARKNSVTHRFVEELEDFGVSLYWHAQGLETMLPNGKRNPAACIILAMLSESARGEVELLRERIKSGLEEARRKGVRLGRPQGSTLSTAQFLENHSEVVRLLRKGHSIRNAAKISDKGISTVQRVKLALAA